jgi:hypothetical protein
MGYRWNALMMRTWDLCGDKQITVFCLQGSRVATILCKSFLSGPGFNLDLLHIHYKFLTNRTKEYLPETLGQVRYL